MANINFNEGYKEYTINGDEDRVIRVNLTDFSIIERIKTAVDEIEKATEDYEDIELKTDGTLDEDKIAKDELAEASEIISGMNKIIREQIDYIFNAPVSDLVFGRQSPLGLVKGVPLFERFLNAIIPEVEKEFKKEYKASEKRVNKYTSKVK